MLTNRNAAIRVFVLASLAAACFVAAVIGLTSQPVVAARPGGGTTSSTTAQSVQIDVHGAGSFIVVDNQTWEYNEEAAAAYFTNELTSGPQITCTGSSTNCADSNQPPTPAAPAPDESKVTGATGAVGVNECTFWDGGFLTGLTYTQSVTVLGLNTKGNWRFTWTYTVAPIDTTTPVAPGTAWELQAESGNTAQITINGFVAGQSVLKQTKGSTSTIKYSFTLLNSDGTSRVSNVVVTVLDSLGAVVGTNSPGHTLVGHEITGDPTIDDLTGLYADAVDWLYVGNGGAYSSKSGGTSLLIDGLTVVEIENLDSVTSNDLVGGTQAVLDASSFDLVPGDYTVNVTGTVKGNAGAVGISFAVSQKLHIHAGTCANN